MLDIKKINLIIMEKISNLTKKIYIGEINL